MVTVRWEGKLGGLTHMARDRMLLERAHYGAISARVYQWDRPWVTLGMFQEASKALLPSQVPFARRPTGGRAVLHGHDVTVGLAAPLDALGIPRPSVRLVYPVIVRWLATALTRAGTEAVLGAELVGEHATPSRSSDCFAMVSPNDIVHPKTGQKVCGCALRLTEKAVLVQASIPAMRPLVDPHLVYADPAPVTWVPVDPHELAKALTGVINEKPQRVDVGAYSDPVPKG